MRLSVLYACHQIKQVTAVELFSHSLLHSEPLGSWLLHLFYCLYDGLVGYLGFDYSLSTVHCGVHRLFGSVDLGEHAYVCAVDVLFVS